MAMSGEAIPAASAGANDALAATGITAGPAAGIDDAQKVFAGNLSFSTPEVQLRNIFGEVGTIQDIQIITRGTRSLGYCFITYSDASEAQQAVAKLNKRVVDGRELNVEQARPQEDLAAAREARASARKEKLAAKKKAAKEAKAQAKAGGGDADVAAATTTTGSDAPAKKSKKRRSRARAARADDGEEADNAVGADASAAAVANGGDAKPKSRSRKSKSNSAATKADLANAGVENLDPKAPKGRKPRAPKGAPQGDPSPTLLFAANLSFDVDDDVLRSFFTTGGVKSAHVVRRRFGARKSKGFAFVDFESEQDRKKAMDELNGKELMGRAISLKVAIQGSQEQQEAEAENEAKEAEVGA
ncbi:unnamed protein product [Jaminaea pallidilutea]